MAAAPLITLAWRDKPPYHYVDNGVAKGFLLERAARVFASARIPVRMVNQPQKRIWANLAHGATNYCSMSWYRLPERAAVAQYTNALHIDAPQSVLVYSAALAQVKSHATLGALLADRRLTLGLVDGVSYGPELDAMIKQSKNELMSRTVESSSMMRMLAVGRASYMFIDREDWNYFRAQQPGLAMHMQRHDFPDMPAGLKRHIVCSRDVAPALMNRLNQAIAATGGPSNSEHEPDDGAKARPR